MNSILKFVCSMGNVKKRFGELAVMLTNCALQLTFDTVIILCYFLFMLSFKFLSSRLTMRLMKTMGALPFIQHLICWDVLMIITLLVW